MGFSGERVNCLSNSRKNLSVDFNNDSGVVSAIRDISFEVNRSEIVAIVGESGSGKTVTSLAVLQLIAAPPAVYKTGEILFSKHGAKQIDLLKLSTKQLTGIRGNEIAMIFQEPMTSLNPVQTCGSQVTEAILAHQPVTNTLARQKALELFKQVGLPQPEILINAYPHQLSGGQKQRVMIAIAMCCHPSLLIADEPTTALDVIVQKKIIQLIKELQQVYKMGVIYITHDLGLVAEIAHKVVVMYKGVIVEAGPVQKIFVNPEHPYTKALLACRPALYTKQQRLAVISDFFEEANEAGSQLPGPDRKQAKIHLQKSLLEVKNLYVYFTKRNFLGKTVARFKAVDDVSFCITKGETVGLAGESGCGKTTLGRALIGMVEPTSGQILFDGQDIAHLPNNVMRAMRKKIQVIFQDPYGSLNPRMTIGRAIQEPLKIHGLFKNDNRRRERVMELLEMVNLKAAHFNRYPHEFSGGQRQRICIARALALSPEFIICDESVSALDVSVQAQVLNLLNDLKREFAFTTIFISHDLAVVHYVSDRILIMQNGRIEEAGSADEIWLNPQKDYTKKLISSIPQGKFRQ